MNSTPITNVALAQDKNTIFTKRLTQILIFVSLFGGLFSVLMWDLRKAHMLSVIIHDDHANLWEPMSPQDIGKWLSPLDRCMMNVSSPDADLRAYRQRNCSKLLSAKSSKAIHLSCGVGASIGGKVCSPPLDSRWYFGAHLKHPLLGNSSNSLLKSALKQYAIQKKPIIFIGDGISKQNQEALLCEILRTDNVVLTGQSSGIDANYTIHWGKSMKEMQLDIYYMKLTAMYDNGEDEGQNVDEGDSINKPKIQRIRRRLLNTIAINNNNNNNSSNNNNNTSNTTDTTNTSTSSSNMHTIVSTTSIIIESKQNRLNKNLNLITNTTNNTNTTKIPLSLTLNSIKTRVEALLNQHSNGIVLIVNVGVWYNSRELFRNQLPDLLNWMEELAIHKNSTVYFRETAAQHWNHTFSGYYDEMYMNRQYDNGTCTPIEDSTPGIGCIQLTVLYYMCTIYCILYAV